MFNVSIRECFSILNVFILCVRNMARSKSNPLLSTHVDSYMFSTLHPPGLWAWKWCGSRKSTLTKIIMVYQNSEPP